MNRSRRLRSGKSGAALLLLLSALPPAAQAVDAIVLEVGELRVAGIPVDAARARLDLLEGGRTRLTITASVATLPDPVGKLSDLTLF